MNKLTKNDNLVEELKSLIATTKEKVTLSVNASLTLMYWHVGFKINENILKNSRAEYGKEIVNSVSAKLVKEFGRGYSKRNLADMIKFSQVFSDVQILQTLSAKLSWSHFKEIIYMDDTFKIEFYTQMSSIDNWSVRTLRNRIDSMLYERTALSKKPDELISYELDTLAEGTVTPNMVLKDPYILDFLDLKDRYLEKDLEDAILRDIENFLLELGNGFSFIARQKRLQIGEDDFYIDLLFYNRKLKRLVAIDLKLGKFKSEYKGQMELYLKWLEKHEMQENENSPLGLILCAAKNEEQIELLELDKSDIHVAEYMTVLPSKEEFEKKLHKVVANAKLKYEMKR